MENPLKVMELDHVVFRCRDIARMLDFYTRVLGLDEVRRVESIGLVQLRAGRGMIDLLPVEGESARDKSPNVDHVCLAIEARDPGDLVRYLKEGSVEVLGEPAMRYGARGLGLSVYIRDPEGNVIELKQMSAGDKS
jgi:catechol 2,3-dioxygenase-like lactoylglutathione lyase family enzyme